MHKTLSKQYLSYSKSLIHIRYFFFITSNYGLLANPKQIILIPEIELQNTSTKPVPSFANKSWNVSKMAVSVPWLYPKSSISVTLDKDLLVRSVLPTFYLLNKSRIKVQITLCTSTG